MNWVFATNSDFLIPLSVQVDLVDLWYVILYILVESSIVSLKYQRFTQSDCNDLGIRKFMNVAKTQFLSLNNILKNLRLYIHTIINIG